MIFQYLNLLIIRFVDDGIPLCLFWNRLYEYHEDKHKQAKHYSCPHYVVLPLEMVLFHFGKLQLSLYVDESQPYLFHGHLLLEALVPSYTLSQLLRHVLLLRASRVCLLHIVLTIGDGELSHRRELASCVQRLEREGWKPHYIHF